MNKTRLQALTCSWGTVNKYSAVGWRDFGNFLTGLIGGLLSSSELDYVVTN